MLGVIKKDQIYDCQIIKDKLPIYWIFCEDISETSSFYQYISTENLLLVKKLRKYIDNDEKKKMFNKVENIYSLLKNNLDSVNNFSYFFAENISNGQEDVCGFLLNDNPLTALVLRVSDLGTNISYVKKGMTVENIDNKDIESIIGTIELLNIVCIDLVAAQAKMEEKILEFSIPKIKVEKDTKKVLKF